MMREPDARAAPRLRFSKEEIQPESLEKLSGKTKQAMKKVNKIGQTTGRETLKEKSQAVQPMKKEMESTDAMSRQGTDEEISEQAQENKIGENTGRNKSIPESKSRLQTGKKKTSPISLRFDAAPERWSKKTAVDQPDRALIHSIAKPIKPLARSVKEKNEAQLYQYEDDNIGLQVAHTAEKAGSSALHTGKQAHELRQNRLRHQAEKKTQTISVHGLTFGETAAGKENAISSGSSNPMSRQFQRKAIQKDYRAAKAGKKTGAAAGKAGREAAERASSVSEKAVEYVGKKKHILVILLLGAMLIFIVQGISACSPLLEAGITALTAGTYPADEADVWAAEQYYANLEWQLQDEMQRYELFHPGYDEYVVDAQETWHDPYALIALISAYNNGEEWTLDDAIPIMQMFFDWQYEKTETVTSAQRYHTEIVNGVETKVWHTVTTCTVTLKNKNLSHAPVYTMSREKVGLYALYMSTHGNMDGLFHGPHVSELKDPLEYEVPQELLDADPQFALLVEEANKRLGYPYVWGGYTPDTSFDCSGFISWIFTETGVRNIGHMGATGLYGISRKISEAELKPGDVIFFSGTIEGEDGITHCGLYVGNGMMVHSGSPCSHYDIAHGTLRNNIAGYGRLYEH
ncbi:MAG: C40 family peptidase [Clostridia bacterium]|nr:C40 family peptidase [Clostridia bacterium]